MAVRALAAGVDTWAPSWRVPVDSALAGHLSDRMTVPAGQGGAMLAEKVAGHRVMWWAGSGLLKAEGHPNPAGLAPPATLPGALRELVAAMHNAGVPPPEGHRRFKRYADSAGFAGLRRVDLAVDLAADSPGDGLAVLSAFHAAAVRSGHHAPAYGRRGKPGRTVYVAGDSGVFGRFYDKGAEAGTAAPGRLLRPEAQWRFAGIRCPDEDDWQDSGWARERFAARWGAWARGRIVVGDVTELGKRLRRAVETGQLSPGAAKRLGGYLLMEAVGGVPGASQRTAERDRAMAREFRFVLVDGVLEPIEHDLGADFAEAERPELWESGATAPVSRPDPSLEVRRESSRRLGDRRPQVDGPRPRPPW
jgi:hypothetical protein